MSNIMIVEDNIHNMRLLKQILMDISEELVVIEAFSGMEAIKKSKENVYKIILMDIALPDIDGFRVSKELKKIINFRNTIFIAITAYSSIEDQEKLSTYFDYYFLKPIDEEKLITLISYLLKEL